MISNPIWKSFNLLHPAPSPMGRRDKGGATERSIWTSKSSVNHHVQKGRFA
jgi:hypothetical protein